MANEKVKVDTQERILTSFAFVLLCASYLNLNIWQIDILGVKPSLLMFLGTLAAILLIVPVLYKHIR